MGLSPFLLRLALDFRFPEGSLVDFNEAFLKKLPSIECLAHLELNVTNGQVLSDSGAQQLEMAIRGSGLKTFKLFFEDSSIVSGEMEPETKDSLSHFESESNSKATGLSHKGLEALSKLFERSHGIQAIQLRSMYFHTTKLT